MVNEITPDGSVVHLTDDSIPKPKYKEVPADIVEELSSTIKLEKKLESEAKSTPVSLMPYPILYLVLFRICVISDNDCIDFRRVTCQCQC